MSPPRTLVGAVDAVYKARRDGVIRPRPCEKCGAEPALAHHHDYSRPLDVRWLCPGCHSRWHAANGHGRGIDTECVRIQIRITREELARWHALAKAESRTLSSWIRSLVRKAEAKR